MMKQYITGSVPESSYADWADWFFKTYSEEKYAAFSASLMNDNIPVHGVRLPLLRRFASEVVKRGLWQECWAHPYDTSFESVLLRGLVLAKAAMPLEEKWDYISQYVDTITSWSLCDSFCVSLKFVKKDPEASWSYVLSYLQDNRTFYQRFGVVMLLDYYLLPDYIDETLKALLRVRPAGYYVSMAIGWALASAFVRFEEETDRILHHPDLNPEVRQLALRKILESRSVSPEIKEKIRRKRF